MSLSTEEKLKLIKNHNALSIIDDYNLKDANGKRVYNLKQISEKHNKSKNSIYRILNKYEQANIEGAEVNWRTKSKQPILLEDVVEESLTLDIPEEQKEINSTNYFSRFRNYLADTAKSVGKHVFDNN